MSYVKDQCFPVEDLKEKIQAELQPYTIIQSKSIEKQEKKNRLKLVLSTKDGKTTTVSLLAAIQYPSKEELSENKEAKSKFFINKRSFENAVKQVSKFKKLQQDLNSSFLEQYNQPAPSDFEAMLDVP